MMSAELPYFWNYAIFGEDGMIAGIRDDAPAAMKRDYAEWVAERERLREAGIKI